MNFAEILNRRRPHRRILTLAAASALAVLFVALQLRADEPYARSRDYDLQHSRIALRFDLDQKKVIGDVTHSLTILRDGTAKIDFDSAGLTIESVTVNKSRAKFESTDDKLIIPLSIPRTPAKNSTSRFATKASPPRASTSFFPTRNIPTARRRSGRRANPKIPITIFRPTTIRTTD